MSESGAGQGSPRGSRAGLAQAGPAYYPLLPQRSGAGRRARGTAALQAVPPVRPCPQESGPRAGKPGCPHIAAAHSSVCTLAVGSQEAVLPGRSGAGTAPAPGAGNRCVCGDKEGLKGLHCIKQHSFLTIVPSKNDMSGCTANTQS